jgi:dihydrofolate reductase
MRKLVVTENITVDGVIDLAGGWFDPLAAGQEDMVAVTAEHSAAADALLVGRNTFEAFREFWPKQTDDPTGVSAYLNGVAKYVVSSRMGDPGWDNSTVLRGQPVEEVRALKRAPGRDIVCTGSIQLAHTLVTADLVDEFRLFVFPVVAGTGARLFERGLPGPHGRLELAQARPFASGAVLLRYSLG